LNLDPRLTFGLDVTAVTIESFSRVILAGWRAAPCPMIQ
jgi:hypothetical protein